MYAGRDTRKHRERQTHNIQVAKGYQVAIFDPVVVQNELENYIQPTPLRQLFSLKTLKVNIIGQTWYFLLIFLVLYYIGQILYQSDALCIKSLKVFKNKTITPANSNHIPSDKETDQCQIIAKDYFDRWAIQEKTMSRLITFLIGFYVSSNVRRWWEQVSRLPDADNLSMILGGLVWAQSEPGPASPEAALHLKKTIVRYGLLSWTMCLTRISSPLMNRFSSAQDYIDKNLLTRREADALKLDLNDCGSPSQWWIPLSWSISMVNDAFNNKVKGKDGLVPKDHKDILSVIIKLRNELHKISEYRQKPMPAIYKQAVFLAVWGWMLVGIVANQSTLHKSDANMALVLVLSFPIHELLKYMLIFGWLQVADILTNPFGSDRAYGLDLVSTLDVNIWKASLNIENQEVAPTLNT